MLINCVKQYLSRFFTFTSRNKVEFLNVAVSSKMCDRDRFRSGQQTSDNVRDGQEQGADATQEEGTAKPPRQAPQQVQEGQDPQEGSGKLFKRLFRRDRRELRARFGRPARNCPGTVGRCPESKLRSPKVSRSSDGPGAKIVSDVWTSEHFCTSRGNLLINLSETCTCFSLTFSIIKQNHLQNFDVVNSKLRNYKENFLFIPISSTNYVREIHKYITVQVNNSIVYRHK